MKQRRFVLEVMANRGSILIRDNTVANRFWLPYGNGFSWRELLTSLEEGDKIIVRFPKKKEAAEK